MMNMMNPHSTRLFAVLVLLLVLLLTSCGDPGEYKGKYSRKETVGAVTMTRYFLVYESCSEQDKPCQQYEREVDEAAYNTH